MPAPTLKLAIAWCTAYRMALQRRYSKAIGRYEDPYAVPFDDLNLSPSRAHLAEIEDVQPALAWHNAEIADPLDWQHAARTKLAGLLGFRRDRQASLMSHRADFSLPNGALRRRIYLQTTLKMDLPVNLVWQPGAASYPIMICLQGTLAGANRSWGEALMPADPIKIEGGADYALQAAERGYLAVCVEQSCYGERREREDPPNPSDPTFAAAIRVLQLGRTLLGERVTDVVQVVDWLLTPNLDDDVLPGAIDPACIHIMGNSLGGATAMFAAALDDRISGVIAASCISSFADMVAGRPPGPDYAIPGILKWLECADVIALSAPRPFVTVSGLSDHIFPFREVEPVTAQAREVYAALDAEDRLLALAGNGGHRFYPKIAWPAFEALILAADQH